MKMTLLCRSESFTFKSYGFAFRSDCFYSFTFHLTASTVCFVLCCGSMMLEGGFQVLFAGEDRETMPSLNLRRLQVSLPATTPTKVQDLMDTILKYLIK
ncbi:hypothetical protein HanXRQr2_Chr11g0472791 [Helianthus annuus]|uniref:Uncharacterized protein n=1 Tax=Helianthus annuus TaxID=4232 RepID=A0A9K3HLM1_HELAN|nr:hypothetical protein HanXRQr2_Chr11g0472791 [Helianthus annuus]KAJ0688137.1 hypothetical protein HanOQP8_Chr11g0391001 [Helianthus annuus]KAJ0873742.1 hypothetical protein HanPSC8_Chr11g0455941 [Helianthus annuus]